MGLINTFKRKLRKIADRSITESSKKGYRKHSFIPSLLADQQFDFSDGSVRKKWCEESALCFNLTHRVADGVAHKPPIFLDEDEEVIEEFYDIWEDVGYQDVFRDGVLETRKHGFVVVEFTDKDFGGRSILTHGADEIQRIKYNKERMIEFYRIKNKLESATVDIVHNQVGYRRIYPAEVVHFYTGRFEETLTGLSVLQPIQFEIIRVYQILDSMARYDARIGRGIMHYVCDIDVYAEFADEIDDALETINDRGFLKSPAEKDAVEPKLEFASASGTMDFVKHAHKLLQMIASATGFSIRYIANEAKGQLSTAKEDRILIWERYKEIFQKYIPFIRELIDKLEGGEEWNNRIAEIVFDDDGNIPSEDADDLEDADDESMPEEKRDLEIITEDGGNGRE